MSTLSRLQDLIREVFLSQLGVNQEEKSVGWSFPMHKATGAMAPKQEKVWLALAS